MDGIVLPVTAEQDSDDDICCGMFDHLQRFWVGTIGGGYRDRGCRGIYGRDSRLAGQAGVSVEWIPKED